MFGHLKKIVAKRFLEEKFLAPLLFFVSAIIYLIAQSNDTLGGKNILTFWHFRTIFRRV